MTTALFSADSRANDPSTERPAGEALHYAQFQTGESATASRFFANAYTPGWRITSLGQGSAITHRRFEADSVTIDELLIDGRLGCEIHTSNSVVVIQPQAGSVTVAADPGTALDSAVIITENMPCAFAADSARLHVVSIDLQLLSKIASAGNGPLPQLIQFADCHPRSEAVLRAWNRALQCVIESFESTDTPDQRLIVAAAANLLGAATLECFSSNLNASQELLSNPAIPPALKGAISFIHRHAADGIGVNDVADAVRLTPRAVQYVFRQHLDTTPTEYLRRVRLHRAHQELKTSERSATTVSEVAQRWGFAHTGRFAALYRQTYGLSPHSTLRQ